MKKHYTFLLSVLSCSLITAQQTKPTDEKSDKAIKPVETSSESTKKLSYHVFAGTTISDLALGVNKAVDYDRKIGFGYYAGTQVGYPLNDQGLSLEGGIKFIQLFNSGDVPALNSDISIKSSLLNIPIDVKQSFSLGSVKCYGKLGGYVGFILNQELEEKTNGTTTTTKYKDYDDAKSIDYGLTGELGVYVYEGLSVNAGYNLGLQNLYDDIGDSKNDFYRYFTLGVSYDLGL